MGKRWCLGLAFLASCNVALAAEFSEQPAAVEDSETATAFSLTYATPDSEYVRCVAVYQGDQPSAAQVLSGRDSFDDPAASAPPRRATKGLQTVTFSDLVPTTDYDAYCAILKDSTLSEKISVETNNECEDVKQTNGDAWHDSESPDHTCAWYAEDDERCETRGNDFENFGRTANTACCACDFDKYCFEFDVSFVGDGLIAETTTDSAKECHEWCQDEEDCTQWTWFTPEHQTDPNKCHGMDYPVDSTSASARGLRVINAISGYPDCVLLTGSRLAALFANTDEGFLAQQVIYGIIAFIFVILSAIQVHWHRERLGGPDWKRPHWYQLFLCIVLLISVIDPAGVLQIYPNLFILQLEVLASLFLAVGFLEIATRRAIKSFDLGNICYSPHLTTVSTVWFVLGLIAAEVTVIVTSSTMTNGPIVIMSLYEASLYLHISIFLVFTVCKIRSFRKENAGHAQIHRIIKWKFALAAILSLAWSILIVLLGVVENEDDEFVEYENEDTEFDFMDHGLPTLLMYIFAAILIWFTWQPKEISEVIRKSTGQTLDQPIADKKGDDVHVEMSSPTPQRPTPGDTGRFETSPPAPRNPTTTAKGAPPLPPRTGLTLTKSKWSVGTVVEAKYPDDGQYYRATIKAEHGDENYTVEYLEYEGDVEISGADIREDPVAAEERRQEEEKRRKEEEAAAAEKARLEAEAEAERQAEEARLAEVRRQEQLAEERLAEQIVAQEREVAQQEAMRRASVIPLPPGWEEHVDDATGDTYYHNESTGQTTWEREECT